ncbi:hypothetical protein C8Q73DRAFT_431115 [Cubamyces lactineus]|nr:hypothetical protein C8Q73DRAFT_431115 [Cubamyces lactineus]
MLPPRRPGGFIFSRPGRPQRPVHSSSSLHQSSSPADLGEGSGSSGHRALSVQVRPNHSKRRSLACRPHCAQAGPSAACPTAVAARRECLGFLAGKGLCATGRSSLGRGQTRVVVVEWIRLIVRRGWPPAVRIRAHQTRRVSEAAYFVLCVALLNAGGRPSAGSSLNGEHCDLTSNREPSETSLQLVSPPYVSPSSRSWLG